MKNTVCMAVLGGIALGGAAVRGLEVQRVEPAKATQGLCILFPAGTGDARQAAIAVQTMGRPLAERGWTVMVPTAPNAKGFFGAEAKVVSDWIDGLPRQGGDLPWGKILFAGISNGGTAALEHAALRPDRTAGVLAVPGLVGASTELAKLSGLRILIRVGDRDELGWARAYESQVRALMRIGASVDARLLPDTPHAFRPPWDDIDGWLALLGTDSLPAAPGIVSAVDAEIRTWRARSGDAVAATLHEEQGPMVALRKPDGETVRIAVANLSREDQWWLEDRREKRQTAVTPSFGFGDSGGGGAHLGPTRPRVTPPVVRFPSDR